MLELAFVIALVAIFWWFYKRSKDPASSEAGPKTTKSNPDRLRWLLFGGVTLALIYFSADIIEMELWRNVFHGQEALSKETAAWVGRLVLTGLFILNWVIFKPKKASTSTWRDLFKAVGKLIDDIGANSILLAIAAGIILVAASFFEAFGGFDTVNDWRAGNLPPPKSAECKRPTELDDNEKVVNLKGRCVRVSRHDKSFVLDLVDGYYDENQRWIQSGLMMNWFFAESMKSSHPSMVARRSAQEFVGRIGTYGTAQTFGPIWQAFAETGTDWVDVYFVARKASP